MNFSDYNNARKDFVIELLPYFKNFLKKHYSLFGDDLEEVIQEFFINFFTGLDTFDSEKGTSFISWSFTVLRNTCADYYRMKKKYNYAELDKEAVIEDKTFKNLEEVDDEITLIENINNKILRRALLQINPRYRKILLLPLLGFSDQQIIKEVKAKNIDNLYNLKKRAKENIKTIIKLESKNHEKSTQVI